MEEEMETAETRVEAKMAWRNCALEPKYSAKPGLYRKDSEWPGVSTLLAGEPCHSDRRHRCNYRVIDRHDCARLELPGSRTGLRGSYAGTGDHRDSDIAPACGAASVILCGQLVICPVGGLDRCHLVGLPCDRWIAR